jgi:hypothetical protein
MIDHAFRPLFALRSFAGVGALVFLSFCGPVGQDACAQATIPPAASEQKTTLSAADLFSKDLEILSKRLGVAFVAEGQPYPLPSSGPVPTLSEKLSQADAVQEVANYFDYSAVRQGDAYLLTKRYTSPEDMPDVTPEECRLGLKSILTLVTPLNPHYPPGTGAGEPRAQIAHMLSPEQLERLAKDGVPVSELTPEQHKEVWKLALYGYIQTTAIQIEQDAAQFENRHPADPFFHHQTFLKMDVFGYDVRSPTLNKMVFIQLSDRNRVDVYSDGRAVLRDPSFSTIDGVKVPNKDGPDITDPSALSDAMKQFLDDKNRSAHATSLSEAISALNGRPANHVVYKVDPMYATKHVTLVSAEKLPAAALMHALAAVYGLRVVEQEDGSVLLTHPSVFQAKGISDLGRAIRSAIPAPIFRALQSAQIVAEKARLARMAANGDPSPRGRRPQVSAMSNSAMRIFRYLAEPQVKSQAEGKLALSRLDERARNLFEFAPTVPRYSQAYSMADSPVPPYLTDFDHSVLTGGISTNPDGATRFSFNITFTDPATGIHSGTGYANAILPP